MTQKALDNMNAAPTDTWRMAKIWNAALEEREERPVKERDHLWASELGRPPVDLFLKLKGTAQTNPPNARALRKFEAGNVYEWIVSLVLKRAGILQDAQKWADYQYPGLLRVSGKADFIAGGVVDYEKAHEFIDFLKRAEIPDVFLRCFDRVILYLKETYPNGIEEMPLEVKSVSTYAMDMLEKTEKSNPMHRKQTFHYLKSMGYKKANIIYICRDDLRMMEFAVHNPSYVETEYKTAIEVISKYVQANEQPPKEKLIIFDEEYGRFSKNLGVEWSPYMTMLYGFQEPREYGEVYGPKATSWNRILSRVKEGKKMTDKNKIILEEIAAEGFNVDEIVEKMKVDDINNEEETTNE